MKRNTHIWQKTLVSMVVSSLLLGGCALPVEQTSSGVSMPSGWGERGDQVKISPEGVPNFSWWQRFGSTELIEMVLLAQSGGYDVAAAAARVRQADARARMAGASLLPEVTGNVNASRDKDVGEPTARSYTMGLSASYEVDIWGEKRASRLSAMASRDAAVFAHDAVLLTLMASTAQSYLRTVAWRERVAIARYNLTAAERVLGLVESRYRVGSASAQETAQQRTLVASLRQVLALRQQQEHQSLTTLAVLLGRPPQKLTVRAVSLSSMKAPTVESGLPTDLLTRRPDVAAAERRLAAADADVTVARAAMLPTVRLTASYGVGSDRVRDVLDNPIYNLAAGLVAPIFNNGRLAAGRCGGLHGLPRWRGPLGRGPRPAAAGRRGADHRGEHRTDAQGRADAGRARGRHLPPQPWRAGLSAAVRVEHQAGRADHPRGQEASEGGNELPARAPGG